MNINKIARMIDTFYSLATAERLPKDSDDLSTVLKNIESLETFAAKKKYAEKNLKHLSSGSSRIVYLTKDKTVVKVAKNDKGLAQNEAEANPKMKSRYLNKILGKAKDFSWLETNHLEKITTKEFENMTNISFDDFCEAVSYGLKDVSSSSRKKPDNFDKVKKSSIYREIERLGNKFKLMPGDIGRISSWGTKDGNPILIDSGLTKKVYEEFYE